MSVTLEVCPFADGFIVGVFALQLLNIMVYILKAWLYGHAFLFVTIESSRSVLSIVYDNRKFVQRAFYCLDRVLSH